VDTLGYQELIRNLKVAQAVRDIIGIRKGRNKMSIDLNIDTLTETEADALEEFKSLNPDYTEEEFKEWFNDVYLDTMKERW
jgi:hypothetical protein